jgi:hypothetical protein
MRRDRQARLLAAVFLIASIAVIGAVVTDWLWGWSAPSVAVIRE